MALRNAFGNLALDTTVASVYSWLQARLGSKTTADSVSVTIASDQTVPVSATSLPLPSGASTSALQTTANTSLSSIDGKLPTLSNDSIQVSDGGFLHAGKQSYDTPFTASDYLVLQADAVPDPQNPTGPALQVTLRDPVQLDPSVAAVTGGIDPTGAVRQTKVGVDGGTQLTDCKQFVGTTQVVNGTPTGWIDTTGYQSIVVTFFGSMAATVAFQTTNDPTYAISNAAGWSVAGGQSAATSVLNPTNGLTYIFPVTGKFFRLVVSAYTSGIVGAVTTLRAAPFTVGNVTTPNINISQVGGVAAQSSGGTSALGVGGTFTSGMAPNIKNDVYGTYTQSIRTQGSNNQSTNWIAPLIVGGLDGTNASRPLLTDTLGAPAVTSAPSNQAQQSIQELLLQILATLRASAHYQYEAYFDGRTRSVADEPDSLIGDYLNQASQFTNIIN